MWRWTQDAEGEGKQKYQNTNVKELEVTTLPKSLRQKAKAESAVNAVIQSEFRTHTVSKEYAQTNCSTNDKTIGSKHDVRYMHVLVVRSTHHRPLYCRVGRHWSSRPPRAHGSRPRAQKDD